MTPKRLQRKRTSGFNLSNECKNPNGYVYVGRPGKWGNPYTITPNAGEYVVDGPGMRVPRTLANKEIAADFAVYMYGRKVKKDKPDTSELRGKDLACWCSQEHSCHADVLLEFANRGGEQ